MARWLMVASVAVLLAGVGWGQTQANTCSNNLTPTCSSGPLSTTVSGTQLKVFGNGGMSVQFMYTWAGSPTGVSTTLQGCGFSGNTNACQLLDVYSGSTTTLRTPDLFSVKAPAGPYSFFLITSTWTGSSTFTVSARISTANNGTGGTPTPPSTSFIDFDTIAGTLDGVNTSFSLSASPLPAASLVEMRNGLVGVASLDYTLSASVVAYTSPPQSTDWLRGSYTVGATSGSLTNFITPTGTINGVNAVFTLPSTPNPAASLVLMRNGAVVVPGIDYNLVTATVTFVSGAKPQTGDVLRASYRTGSVGSFNFADFITPTGTINGVNVTFTLPNAPVGLSLDLMRNDLILLAGADYNLAGSTVTFVSGAQPRTGDVLRASYRF